MSADFGLAKIAKLNKPPDYIQWKRRVYAVIRREDPLLVCFNDAPQNTSGTAYTNWMKSNAKAKSTIILCLGDTTMAKTRLLVDDDDKSAKMLWDELQRIFTVSSTQAVANLHSKLEEIKFLEGANWDNHVSDFMSIIDELAGLDQHLTDQDKVTKIIRSLPQSFDALAMASTLSTTSFDDITSAVSSNIERRKNSGTWKQTKIIPQAYVVDRDTGNEGYTPTFRGGRGRSSRGRSRGRGSRGRGGTFQGRNNKERNCHYCGKPGHFIKFCRFRISEEENGRIRKPNHTRGGNSNGQGWNRSAQSHPMTNPMDQDENPVANYAHANQAFDNPPPPAPNNRHYQQPQARMAQVKYRSNVAKIGSEKTDTAYIDSGATHNFFHRRSSFIEYENINPEVVRVAHGNSKIVGKGTVRIWIGTHLITEAYHAPEFTSNILAANILSETFEILISSSLRPYKACFIFKFGSVSKDDVIWETACMDGLYPVNCDKVTHDLIPHKNAMSAQSTRDFSSYEHWHGKVGHISSDRYIHLSSQRNDVPDFSRSIINSLECVPCITAKTKKAPISRVPVRVPPYHEVHFDLSGPFYPSLGGNIYAAHLFEPRTAKSDISLIKSKSELPRIVQNYISMVENHFSVEGYRVKTLRSDRAKENMTSELTAFCKDAGIFINRSPAYAPESNGLVERLVQEHWTRARVLLFATDLPKEFWGEAISHANWLRNRLPCSRIDNKIPILEWDNSGIIDFDTLLEFGTHGYSFIYYPRTVAKRKLLPRSELSRFVGMESDTRLIRVFVIGKNEIRIVRRADFHPTKSNILPSISSFLDGLSRQRSIEESENAWDDSVEEDLQTYIVAMSSHLIPHKSYAGISDGPPLPRSFKDACSQPQWADAIDREYNALARRETWKYIPITSSNKPVPFKWSFRAKQIDANGSEFVFKARCTLRGDMQEAYHDYDPENLYAPVAAHESIRMLLSIASSNGLIIEGCDVSNAYLHGYLDIPIIMEQPTDSSGKLAVPGHVCLLIKSLYGAKQAGRIWGVLLHEKLTNWGFQQSTVEHRLYFLKRQKSYIILCVVVDDIAFASNDQILIKQFKNMITSEFDVKLYGTLKSFIRWTVTRSTFSLKIDQRQYSERLLVRFGLQECNAVLSPLGTDCDLRPRFNNESPLVPSEHHNYRAMVGGIAYLAACTRPDLTFSVSALARHLHDPCHRHVQLAKRVLRYVSGTLDYGIKFPSNCYLGPDSIHAAVDADWGGDKENRKSTTGFVISINAAPIFWRSKRQTIVALSSAESEYIALSACAKEVSWIRKMFWEMCHQSRWNESYEFPATTIEVDSTSAISIATRDNATSRTKHIDLKCHHVRDLVSRSIIILKKVPTQLQVADSLTKPATVQFIRQFVSTLRMSEQI